MIGTVANHKRVIIAARFPAHFQRPLSGNLEANLLMNIDAVAAHLVDLYALSTPTLRPARGRRYVLDVASRKMPPWFADPQYGHYTNDRSLRQSEIDTIAKWADSGAPEGDAKDAPIAMQWPEGWKIQPDVIVPGPVMEIPAHPKNNVVEWISVIMPTGFTKDTWVTSVQIKPEHPEVTHHICIAYMPHNPKAKMGVPHWQDKERDEEGAP